MVLSSKISRYEVRPGDHIFTYRYKKLKPYAHHGIYVGNGRVIHFTNGTKSFITSSLPNHGVNPCPTCGDQRQRSGVLSSCLDCFLAGGSMRRFKYSENPLIFLAKFRGGTCSTMPSDPPGDVCRRAEYLLQNDFADYNFLKNNCESFATYCKTGVVSIDKAAPSSQVYSGDKAVKIATGGTVVTGLATVVGSPLLGAVVGSLVVFPGCISIGTFYNIRRLIGDKKLKKRRKVPVEDVSNLIKSGLKS